MFPRRERAAEDATDAARAAGDHDLHGLCSFTAPTTATQATTARRSRLLPYRACCSSTGTRYRQTACRLRRRTPYRDPAELGLEKDGVAGLDAELVRVPPMYSMWPVIWKLCSPAENSTASHVEGVAVVGTRGAAGADSAAAVDVEHQVRVQEDEPGRLPGQTQARQVLHHLRVAGGVQAGDEADIDQRAAPDRLPGQLAETHGRIPLGVEVPLVEAVAALVVDVVDEEEAVAVLPLRGLLQRQDEALLLLRRERVQEFAVLEVKLGLGRGLTRGQSEKQQDAGSDEETPPESDDAPGAPRPHATSNSPAAPMPPPTHIVTTTFLAPRRLPSISAWPTMRAPLIP